MPVFRAKTIRGITYPLDHLDPFSFALQNGEKIWSVRVQFGCHCFTEQLSDHHTPDFRYKHENEIRAFDLQRYDLSQHLPQLVATLGSRTVYKSNQINYFTLRQDAHPNHPGPYLVFFGVHKLKHRSEDVLMNVESAYIKPNMTDRASSVKFTTLIEKTALGEKVPRGPLQAIKRK
jgi:hypothetical protein